MSSVHITKGSKKHNTSVINEEDCDMMLRTFCENAINELPEDTELTEELLLDIVSEAKQDMAMLDTMLHMKRLHFATRNHTSYTANGNLRKGSSLYNHLDDLVTARLNGKFNKQ
jgi:hypothetical protein